MKILKNKTYKDLLNKIEHLEKTRDDYYQRIVKAEDLKTLLEKYSEKLDISFTRMDGMSYGIPDDVLRYVDDILGGKVIKQEGTKCLVIDVNGNVKTGLTKQKRDPKYTYKLVRE